jgi:hypothetical protein
MSSLDPTSIAQAFQAAMPTAWVAVKGGTFPGDPNEPNQKVLFLAIAQGLLTYLDQRQADVITSMDLTTAGLTPVKNTVSNLVLNITGV